MSQGFRSGEGGSHYNPSPRSTEYWFNRVLSLQISCRNWSTALLMWCWVSSYWNLVVFISVAYPYRKGLNLSLSRSDYTSEEHRTEYSKTW